MVTFAASEKHVIYLKSYTATSITMYALQCHDCTAMLVFIALENFYLFI